MKKLTADNRVSNRVTGKPRVAERKLKESIKYEFRLVYVNNQDSYMIDLGNHNYKDVDALQKQAIELSIADSGSDDVWIDQIIQLKGDSDLSIDWTKLLCNNGTTLDQDMVDNVFTDEEFPVKAYFLLNAGYDIDKHIEDVLVLDTKHDDILDGNFHNSYPETFIDEWTENTCPDLVKLLKKYNCDSYMNFARYVSDAEVNGEFTGSQIGDYYVYMYGN